MQWKSLVFILATAAPALARSHGQHKHRHGAHQENVEARAVEAAQEVGGFVDPEPFIVTETVWECCTTSSLSSITPTEPATFIETSTATPVETPTETPEPPVETSTSTAVPTETEPTSTSTAAPVTTEEPETTSTTVAPSTTSTAAATSTTLPDLGDLGDWLDFPSDDDFCFDGFGGRTEQAITGNKFTYEGNVGIPWGSNMIEVSAKEAAKYKYVVQFHGSKTDTWTVVIWNKIGPDGKMTGWYGNSAITMTFEPEEIRYVAFDENSQGSWGAAKGDSLPVDEYGGYSCTWGEFDLGSTINKGWSGWDVSAIQAEAGNAHIQGMKMCAHDESNCSIITTGAAKVVDAYMEKDKWADGIGGKVVPGPVRIVTHLDYSG
ncbi:hypothetical protein BJX99DRAFT_21690 [Aspergillus californicus]